MLKRLVYISGLLLAFLATEGVLAQDVKLEVKSPERVKCGEPFYVHFEIIREGDNLDSLRFELPEEWPEEIRMLREPMFSFGSSVVAKHGEITRTERKAYTYFVEITTPGEVTFPSFKATLAGEDYTTGPVKIQVEEGEGIFDREDDAKTDTIPQPREERKEHRKRSTEPLLLI